MVGIGGHQSVQMWCHILGHTRLLPFALVHVQLTVSLNRSYWQAKTKLGDIKCPTTYYWQVNAGDIRYHRTYYWQVNAGDIKCLTTYYWKVNAADIILQHVAHCTAFNLLLETLLKTIACNDYCTNFTHVFQWVDNSEQVFSKLVFFSWLF